MDEDLDRLARSARDGDRNAMKRLLERGYGDMLRFARRLTLPGVDYEDAVQEAAVRISRSIRSFRGESAARTWMLSITRNCVLDANRAAARRSRRETIAAVMQRLEAMEELGRSEDRYWLREILQRMDEPTIACATLVLEIGLSHDEAGKVLGCAPGTIAWRMNQLRQKLAQTAFRQAAE